MQRGKAVPSSYSQEPTYFDAHQGSAAEPASAQLKSSSQSLDRNSKDWAQTNAGDRGGKKFYSDGFESREGSVMPHMGSSLADEQYDAPWEQAVDPRFSTSMHDALVLQDDPAYYDEGYGQEFSDELLPDEHITIPEEFICPLSQDIMTDPVIIASGVTYDRLAIMEWFTGGERICPSTGEPLEHFHVVPNSPLKAVIQSWLAANSHVLGLQYEPVPEVVNAEPANHPTRLASNGKGGRVTFPPTGHQGEAMVLNERNSLLEAAQSDESPDKYGQVRRSSTDRRLRPKFQEVVAGQHVWRSDKERPFADHVLTRNATHALPPRGPSNLSSQPAKRTGADVAPGGMQRSGSTENLAMGGPGGMKMTRRERDKMLAAMGGVAHVGSAPAAPQQQQCPPLLEGSSSAEHGQAQGSRRGGAKVHALSRGSSMESFGSPLNSPALRSPVQRTPAHSGLIRAAPDPRRMMQPECSPPEEGREPYRPPVRAPIPTVQSQMQRAPRALTRMASVPTSWDQQLDVAAALAEEGMLQDPNQALGGYPGLEMETGGAACGPLGSRARALLQATNQEMAPGEESSAPMAVRSGGRGLRRQGSLHVGAVLDAPLPQRIVPLNPRERGGAGNGAMGKEMQGGGGGQSQEQSHMQRLVDALKYGREEERRAAAKEIRSMVKASAEGREKLVEAQGIEPLLECMAAKDQDLVELSSAALMYLALHHNSCPEIVYAGGISVAVKVLSSGTPAAKGYAAALVFAACQEEENKLLVRAAGAIPVLVALLPEGTLRSKKDAALALYSLSTSGRCAKDIIKAGAVKRLVKLVECETDAGLEEKAVALVASLCRFGEGCQAAVDAGALTKMVDLLDEGSTLRVKEDAAAILLQMNAAGHATQEQLLDEGVLPALVLISQSSTSTSEAKTLLDLLRKKSSERTGKSG